MIEANHVSQMMETIREESRTLDTKSGKKRPTFHRDATRCVSVNAARKWAGRTDSPAITNGSDLPASHSLQADQTSAITDTTQCHSSVKTNSAAERSGRARQADHRAHGNGGRIVFLTTVRMIRTDHIHLTWRFGIWTVFSAAAAGR